MSIGFTLPFSVATGSLGYFQMTDDEYSAIKQNIKSVLVTNWGERVMHYNFGCNLIEFLFENRHGEDVRVAIIDRIVSQMGMWLPFVNVDDVIVVFQEDDESIPDHAIGVRIRFSLVEKPDRIETFDYLVNQ